MAACQIYRAPSVPLSTIDFDSIDNQPVDLLFALLVPEDSSEEHLQLLAQLAEMFANKDFCDKLRLSTDPEKIYHLFTDFQHA